MPKGNYKLNDVKSITETVQWAHAFGGHLWRHFLEDRCFEAAGSLSYKTLIALVPLLAVVIGMTSAFGLFEQWVTDIEAYVFTHFVPAKGTEIQGYLNQFIDRSAGLTGAGSIVLIIIAVLLMNTIERSFNRIWRVRRPRAWLSRFVIYWAVLTLGPLLLGASLALTSYFAVLSALAPELLQQALESVLARTAPFLVAWLGFGLMFILIPHRRVYIRHAAVGAFFSAILFEVAKAAFVVYVSHSSTYEDLYGALAIVPIFLMWIYVLWVVVLLGASLTAALTTFNMSKTAWQWTESDRFVLLIRLIFYLHEAQARGEFLTPELLHQREPGATDDMIQQLLGLLAEHGWVSFDESGAVVLTMDLAERTVQSLYVLDDFSLPVFKAKHLRSSDALDQRMIDFFGSMTERLEPMTQPLKSLLSTSAMEKR